MGNHCPREIAAKVNMRNVTQKKLSLSLYRTRTPTLTQHRYTRTHTCTHERTHWRFLQQRQRKRRQKLPFLIRHNYKDHGNTVSVLLASSHDRIIHIVCCAEPESTPRTKEEHLFWLSDTRAVETKKRAMVVST